jgi:hypothetical protein
VSRDERLADWLGSRASTGKSNFEVVMKSAEVLGRARTAPRAFAAAAPSATSDASDNGGKEKPLDLHCNTALAAAVPQAPASFPGAASAPQPTSASGVKLSAVAFAEIKTTVQGTITRAMTIHRHFVAQQMPSPSAINIFYDNHGEVTVNNLGAALGASSTPRTATVDTHATRTPTSASATTSATSQAAAGSISY